MGGGAGVAAVITVESKEWYLAAYAPQNVPTSEHIKLRTVNVSLDYDSIPDQHVLVQLLMFSVDPYLRNVITGRDGDLYLPQILLNKVLTEFGIARVVRSKNSNFNEGDIVVNGFSLIAEYSVIPSDFLRKIDPTANINLPDYINCLGPTQLKDEFGRYDEAFKTAKNLTSDSRHNGKVFSKWPDFTWRQCWAQNARHAVLIHVNKEARISHKVG
ncbi:NADP(+)-dependent 2-alkenal reductase-like protein [Tanacetum coccineum]